MYFVDVGIEVTGGKKYVDCVGRLGFKVCGQSELQQRKRMYFALSTVLQPRTEVLRLLCWCTTNRNLTISVYCQYVFILK